MAVRPQLLASLNSACRNIPFLNDACFRHRARVVPPIHFRLTFLLESLQPTGLRSFPSFLNQSIMDFIFFPNHLSTGCLLGVLLLPASFTFSLLPCVSTFQIDRHLFPPPTLAPWTNRAYPPPLDPLPLSSPSPTRCTLPKALPLFPTSPIFFRFVRLGLPAIK